VFPHGATWKLDAQGEECSPMSSVVREPLRILFLSDTGEELGGAEQSLLSLVEHLDPKRHVLHALLFSEGRFATLLRGAHVSVRIQRLGTIARTRNPLKLLFYFACLVHGVLTVAWLVWRLKIDIVHVNKNTLVLHGIPGAKLGGARSIWHVRNPVSNFGRIGARLIRWADRIVLVSKCMGVPFRESFPWFADKLTVIGEGIEVLQYDAHEQGAAFRESIGVGPDEILVGSVGRFTRWKGQDDFLRAAARVLEKRPETRFVVEGDCVSSRAEQSEDERFAEELRALVDELGLSESVIFTGYRSDVAAVMNGLDIFVLPSHFEPFGIVVLEAMASDCGIVATGAGGVPDIVRHEQEGLLVPPKDPEALADAVLRLVDDEALRASLSNAARERVAHEFPLWRHVARMREMYEGLVTE